MKIEEILSFIKGFDNSNSAIIDFVIKKDNDNLRSNKHIKGPQSFFEEQTIYLRLMIKITKYSEDKFEKINKNRHK